MKIRSLPQKNKIIAFYNTMTSVAEALITSTEQLVKSIKSFFRKKLKKLVSFLLSVIQKKCFKKWLERTVIWKIFVQAVVD